jgi:hypothetical protein
MKREAAVPELGASAFTPAFDAEYPLHARLELRAAARIVATTFRDEGEDQ